MRVHKAYKYRIYPNEEQKEKLAKTFGGVRFIWNKFVESFNDTTSTIPKYTKYNDYKAQFNFLNDVSAGALQQQDQNISAFKKQFFNPSRKTKVGSPSFKHKEMKASYKLPNRKFDVRGDEIYLEKIGLVDIKINNSIPKNAKLLSCTVSRNSTNQYFVSIAVEVDIKQLPKTGKTIGIDLGIKDFVITSEGDKHAAKKWFRDNQTKLRKEQKRLSKKKKDSVRYKKNKQRIAKIYNDLVNQRNYFQHNLSKHLVEKYDIICLESLNVKGMLKNRKLSKAILEVSWSSFITMLKYKALWYGKDIIQIDRFFPSSKTCHVCGCINDKLKLKDRVWFCEHCETNHDRDINAAKNIELEGLRIFRAPGSTVAIHTLSLNKTNKRSNTNISISDEALNKQDDKVLFNTIIN